MKTDKFNILVVAAHPDDEVLGCGGTVARLAREGHDIFTLILGEGITSRDLNRDTEESKSELSELKGAALQANKALGVKDVFLYDYPDNRFDTVAFLDIVKIVEKVKRDIGPKIIFTHYGKDLNIDHQIVYQAVLTAARPLPEEIVRQIYSFEVPSSTEWNYPARFSPDVFFDISETVESKLAAMKIYRTELNDFPHPRSLEGIELNSRYWGMQVGLRHAEAFKSVRVIR